LAGLSHGRFWGEYLDYIRASEAVLEAGELTDHKKDAVQDMLNRLAEMLRLG
jgi:hypothetical protein